MSKLGNGKMHAFVHRKISELVKEKFMDMLRKMA